jgi:hypothetical protein
MPLKCTLCDQEKPLIGAHIIPKKYFFGIRGSERNLMELQVGEDDCERKISQSGIKDKSILCATCDQGFGIFDNYAYSLFPPKPDLNKIQRFDENAEIYPLGHVDDRLLKKFIISTLWRLHVTKERMGYQVDLGIQYKGIFKRNLMENSDWGFEYIDCLCFLKLHHTYPDIMQQSFRSKFEGINCYQMFIPPWRLIVRIDKRPFDKLFQKFALIENRPAHAILQRNWTKGEAKFMGRVQDLLRAKNGLPPL